MTKPVRITTWFRVELHEDGSLLSCEPTARPGDESELVFYIRANASKSAERAAFNAYHRVRQRANRAKLKTEGRCKCGRVLDRGGAQCSECRKRSKVYHERAERKARGEKVEKLSPSHARDARRDRESRLIRLSVFEELDAKWREMGTAAFRLWFRKELRALAARSAA